MAKMNTNILHREDGGITFLRKVDNYLQKYTASQTRWFYFTVLVTSRGSSVSAVPGYGLDDQGDRGSIPGRGLSPDRLWGPPSLLYNGYWGSFPGGKARPGRDADHSPPSSAEVVNE
jgi:hypothetical protein